jgi:hypothetical protein
LAKSPGWPKAASHGRSPRLQNPAMWPEVGLIPPTAGASGTTQRLPTAADPTSPTVSGRFRERRAAERGRALGPTHRRARAHDRRPDQGRRGSRGSCPGPGRLGGSRPASMAGAAIVRRRLHLICAQGPRRAGRPHPGPPAVPRSRTEPGGWDQGTLHFGDHGPVAVSIPLRLGIDCGPRDERA